jgi:hypothetical protein
MLFVRIRAKGSIGKADAVEALRRVSSFDRPLSHLIDEIKKNGQTETVLFKKEHEIMMEESSYHDTFTIEVIY